MVVPETVTHSPSPPPCAGKGTQAVWFHVPILVPRPRCWDPKSRVEEVDARTAGLSSEALAAVRVPWTRRQNTWSLARDWPTVPEEQDSGWV